jgi:hypothetical protein
LSAPVRVAVEISVVGDGLPTTPAGVDGVDLVVLSLVVDIGYLAGLARKVGLRRLGVKYHHEQSTAASSPAAATASSAPLR